MAEKLFYSMGEVAEMFDVKASLLRHWETQFPQLKPKRNAKGNRLYTPRDVEMLKQIYLLVKERGMTLDGAKRALRRMKGDTSGVDRDAELMERLQRIRALLVEVREDLKGDAEAVYASGDDAAAGEELSLRAGAPRSQDDADGMPDEAAEAADEQAPVAPESNPEGGEDAPESPGTPARRQRRRRKSDADHRELFAFYEQSLF